MLLLYWLYIFLVANAFFCLSGFFYSQYYIFYYYNYSRRSTSWKTTFLAVSSVWPVSRRMANLSNQPINQSIHLIYLYLPELIG